MDSDDDWYDDDWDDDGMLDTWERSQGIDPNDHTDGAADPDLDGMNNLGEYISMTDPANAASVFSVSSIDPALSGFGLSFYAATGRTYTVDYKDDLSDTNDWQVFLGNITTNVSGQMTIQDTNGVPRRYYRIKVELSP